MPVKFNKKSYNMMNNLIQFITSHSNWEINFAWGQELEGKRSLTQTNVYI